jgi:hypothetical protein
MYYVREHVHIDVNLYVNVLVQVHVLFSVHVHEDIHQHAHVHVQSCTQLPLSIGKSVAVDPLINGKVLIFHF